MRYVLRDFTLLGNFFVESQVIVVRHDISLTHFLRKVSSYSFRCKVKKILEGSLDLIPSPSPSVKIQIIGGKVGLGCKSKTLLGAVN